MSSCDELLVGVAHSHVGELDPRSGVVTSWVEVLASCRLDDGAVLFEAASESLALHGPFFLYPHHASGEARDVQTREDVYGSALWGLHVVGAAELLGRLRDDRAREGRGHLLCDIAERLLRDFAEAHAAGFYARPDSFLVVVPWAT